MPYVAHKRLVTVIHLPYHTVYHGGSVPSLIPIRVHARVRPSVLAAEINRIRNLTRPSTESYTEKYLQSKDHIYFDDEAREIRARVDSLLRRVHVFIPRAVASDFAEEIVPERMRSGDYVRRLISGKQNAKKEAIEPISWYEVPDRGNFGNLACVKYVAGKPQSVRKPYFKVADLRPSDIKNDVNFLSYYSKNREAAANASQDVPMTERELRKARALQPDLDESTLRKAVETDKKTESKPEKKRESKREQAETKETKDEAAKTSVLEPVKEPEKEIRAEPERAKGPEVTSEIVAQPESVSEKEPESVKEPEPAKAPEREPVKEAKSLKRAKRAKEPEPAKEAKPSKEPEPAKKAEPVKESEGPTQEAEPAKEPVKEQEPAKQAETVDVPEPVKEPELETAKVAEPATRTESELTEEVEVAKEPESPATESAKSLESEIVRQSESEAVQEPVSGLESKQEAIPETSSEPQTTEAVSQSGKTDEEATNENVKQEKEAAIKRIETYLVKAAEEARSQEEKTQAAEEKRVRLELDELKAWEALQIAQERVAHLDEIVEQEQAEAQRQAEEEKLETQRLETERILEEEREIAEAKTTALLKQQEQAIIEEHLEKARQDEEKEERLANVTFDDADEVKDIDHSCDDVVTYDITDQEREERPYDPITDDDTRIEEEAHEEEHFELSEDPFVEEPEGAENRPVTGGNAVEESPKIEEVTSGGEESFEWGDENA